jgi:xanthine dehydrogenase YagR molybdenum-binding subunit
MRDGSELVGWGMATGVWEALQMPIAVRIVLTANGHAEVSCATSDIGTGTYTIMAQVAADMLGLPIDNITSSSAIRRCRNRRSKADRGWRPRCRTRIATTAEEVRKELLRLAKQMPDSPLADATPDDVVLADGKLVSKHDASRARCRSRTRCAMAASTASSRRKPPASPRRRGKHARNTHSAVFAEVKVDEQLGVIRVTRVVSAVAAGRILNTKTARSQIMGGVVWGIGMALHEETLIDHNSAAS